MQVPGTAALNQGGFALITSVSCAPSGTCSAGGSYNAGSADGFFQQAFVVDKVNGAWGTAMQVPGLAALNQGGNAAINSVSCAPAGTCGAGGFYTDSSGHVQAFVVSRVNGAWGTAMQVPGLAALNQGGNAAINSVSCAPGGTCGAGGQYTDSSGQVQAFVVNQVNGAWGTAIEVPGTAALNQGGFAAIFPMSCTAAGTCSAGGQYTDSSGGGQAFVVNQVNGTWGTAIQIPGTAALNQGGFAAIESVSCAPSGSCGAGGGYTDSSGQVQAFVVNQVNGTWGTAMQVPGTAALNQGGFAAIFPMSCLPSGSCSAGGAYTDSSGGGQAFVVNQVNGTWGTAIQVPGTAALNQGGFIGIDSMSCAPSGSCSAVGNYIDSSGHVQTFVVNKA
jgi:hypothetical protein